ncbi:MAG: DNA/RNA nuclease SfsA, partial [Acutalibacteraceae bacterium]|nr:DNA/RNA nuclease SfsA [Acutalibacteraceae bacterium]
MKYNKTIRGKFVSRPNRFIAMVEINGKIETVHVKNTGRCKELLLPGVDLVLEVSDNPTRKTKYDLIAVYK